MWKGEPWIIKIIKKKTFKKIPNIFKRLDELKKQYMWPQFTNTNGQVRNWCAELKGLNWRPTIHVLQFLFDTIGITKNKEKTQSSLTQLPKETNAR